MNERFRHRGICGAAAARFLKKKICRRSTAARLPLCWSTACAWPGAANKVTARFVDIADWRGEAHYAAKAADEHVVRAEHVRKGAQLENGAAQPCGNAHPRND